MNSGSSALKNKYQYYNMGHQIKCLLMLNTVIVTVHNTYIACYDEIIISDLLICSYLFIQNILSL